MKTPPNFLTVEQVCEIHERMIEEYGGEAQIRDLGLLESAVAMPAAQFGGQFLHASLIDMAAAYLFHICKNHAFVDGNKRTALAASGAFLLLNGYCLIPAPDGLEQLTLSVADSTIGKAELTKALRKFVKRDKR